MKSCRSYRVTLLAMCVAAAMLLSFVESRIPTFIPVPGVRIGLANIAVLFALRRIGLPSAAAVSLVRVLISALLFGNVAALIYGLSGATLSLLSMYLLIRFCRALGTVGVSVAGGVMHNVGQLAAACLVMGTGVLYYLPVLVISGTVAGVLTGLLCGELLRRTEKLK